MLPRGGANAKLLTVNTSARAVFLSYASQDAEAARHIRDALQAIEIEVWFDQTELRGGDAWDASIRKKIKECAVFVAIISANTEARDEATSIRAGARSCAKCGLPTEAAYNDCGPRLSPVLDARRSSSSSAAATLFDVACASIVGGGLQRRLGKLHDSADTV
jgi:hypothetical protein